MKPILLLALQSGQENANSAIPGISTFLQYGAIGACLLIFIIISRKLYSDVRDSATLMMERDNEHDKIVRELNDKMLAREREMRAELMKVTVDYAEALRDLKDLTRAVNEVATRSKS